MQDLLGAIQESTRFLQQQGLTKPLVGIVLGTGLNAMIEQIEVEKSFPYHELPHFPQTTVAFHKGMLLFGKIGDAPVVVMQGRFHYYEGYSMQQITFPIRILKELGIQYLFLSNAAGGLNKAFKKGDLIITEDHINLLPDNPLRGIGEDFGNHFVDMSVPYDQHLQKCLKQEFEKEGVSIKKGVYVSVMGPNLETRAEYRWLRSMGADMVGMSTVPEVIVANQLGIACAAISVITDECDPENLKPVDIAEIIEVAGKADQKLSRIIANTIRQLNFN